MSLILTEIPSFVLFPGQVSLVLRSHRQIVGVEGVMNNRRVQVAKLYPVGDRLRADIQGFPVAPHAPPTSMAPHAPPASMAPHAPPTSMAPHAPPTSEEAMQIVVARGPFTSRDDGEYEQLRELLRVCGESKPSLLVLVSIPSRCDA